MENNFLSIMINLKANDKFSNGMENALMMKKAAIVQSIFKKQDELKEKVLNFYVSKGLIPKSLSSYEITMNILFLLHFH
jgi:hypothetical protein